MDRHVSPVEPDALAAVLSGQFDQSVTVKGLTATTVGARRATTIVDVEFGSKADRVVVTIIPAGQEGHNPITAEAEMIERARAAGVRAAPVIMASEDTSLIGGSFMITSFVAGETVPRRVLRRTEQSGSGPGVVEQIGRSLARLHSLDWKRPPIGLRLVEGTDPVAAALDDLSVAVDQLPMKRPVLELARSWLAANRPDPPDRRSFVHGDVRTGNIVVDDQGLAAILDWELTTAGADPTRDLAWTAVRMWRFGHDHLEIGGLGRREDLLGGYQKEGGSCDPDRFEWWKVAETMRWALGLAAQSSAFVEGRSDNIVLAASGRRVSELEWDLLMLIKPPT